jgi:CBS domain-containing protein
VGTVCLMRIGQILTAKASQDVVTISPDAGVRELIALLAEHNIGALIVSRDGTSLDGIVSERDVVRHLHSDGTVINNTVSAIMTEVVETCSPDDDLDEVMQTMTERRFRHIPVCSEAGDLVGIISIGDVVKHKIGQLEFERNQLDGYIHQQR